MGLCLQLIMPTAQILKADLLPQSLVFLICMSSFFCPQWQRLLHHPRKGPGQAGFLPVPSWCGQESASCSKILVKLRSKRRWWSVWKTIGLQMFVSINLKSFFPWKSPCVLPLPLASNTSHSVPGAAYTDHSSRAEEGWTEETKKQVSKYALVVGAGTGRPGRGLKLSGVYGPSLKPDPTWPSKSSLKQRTAFGGFF